METDKHVRIFDTTLRDGQQCPGAGMSFEQNLEYARLASKIGIDILEAGFPSASKLDFDIVKEIAKERATHTEGPVIAGLCQLRDEQIDKTIEAVSAARDAGAAMMHVYLPVDPNLMDASLGKDAEDKSNLVQKVYDFVKRAVDAGLLVEFSPEGYSRQGANFDFVTDTIRAAVSAGACTINCPDTIGGASEYEGDEYFVEKMKKHAEIISREFPDKKVIWSTHCHNDLGLAVQNSVNAVFNGPALQIEGCINGIGERAGNAALEQCVMVIKQFASKIDPESPYYTKINSEFLQEISDFVHKNMLPRQPHWPVSGANAARHSSGGHTNAILKNPLVYQPFDPNEVGKSVTLVFGPLSGGNHARSIIEENGYVCDNEEKSKIAQFIKNTYSERRKGVTDEELMRAYFAYRSPIQLSELDFWHNKDISEIALKGKFFSREGEIKDSLPGKESALATLKKLIDREWPGLHIENYRSESIGKGISAISRSYIILSSETGENYQGQADDQDISISAMKSLVSAVNQAYIEQHYRKKE